MKRTYVNIPEGQVHYQIGGSGESLLLLHATPASSEEYRLMIPILAKSHKVIAMDTLGYGKSDKPPHQYYMPDYARSVTNFLGALDISRASILGHLTGASIAIEVAASNPELVDKLILTGCRYYPPNLREERRHDAKFRSRVIKEDGSHLMEIWQFLKFAAPTASPETIQQLFADYLLAGTRVHEGQQAVFAYDIEQRLPLIKSPTLLIDVAKDIPYSQLEAIKNLIPKCKRNIIEGGTWISMEKPDEMAQAILEFLRNPNL